jgi:glycosyltransferase involved in cell wall biosynthesis
VNVLHVIDALALGGAERMLVEIANRTVADGHHVTVCATRAGGLMQARLDPRIACEVLGRRSRYDVRPLARMVRLAGDFDVIHCHGRSSFSLLALLAATRTLRTPIVLHDHLGVEVHPHVPTWIRIARRYLAAYVGVYDQHRTWARRAGIPSERIRVIGNAFDPAKLACAPREPLAGAAPRLLFVGGLRREKAVDVLLEAMVGVSGRLYVVGGDADPSYARACRERAARPDLVDRVVFLGQREDALALATSAELAVHPARSESGPLVIAEYAVLGVPFVATRVGGIARALEAARVGRFVDPDDVNGLATAITDALRAPREPSSAERARAMFDIGNVMPRWYEVYASVAP